MGRKTAPSISPYKKQYGGFQTIKNKITTWYSNCTSGYRDKRTENRDLNRYVLTRDYSSTIYDSQRWEQPKCPPTDERTSEMGQRISFGLEKRKFWHLLPHGWTLSEKSQWQKDWDCTIPLTGGTWRGHSHRDSKQNGGCQGGCAEPLFTGQRSSFVRWKVLEMN